MYIFFICIYNIEQQHYNVNCSYIYVYLCCFLYMYMFMCVRLTSHRLYNNTHAETGTFIHKHTHDMLSKRQHAFIDTNHSNLSALNNQILMKIHVYIC